MTLIEMIRSCFIVRRRNSPTSWTLRIHAIAAFLMPSTVKSARDSVYLMHRFVFFHMS